MLGRWFLFNHLWAVTRLSLSSHRTVVVWQLEASRLTLEPVKLHPLLTGCDGLRVEAGTTPLGPLHPHRSGGKG